MFFLSRLKMQIYFDCNTAATFIRYASARRFIFRRKNVMHIDYTHVYILRKKYLHTGRYLFIKGKKYIYAKRDSVVKNKDQYFNCKPVFRKKYAFRMRYSHNNVVHHSRSTNSALATKDRLREIGDRSVYRTIDRSLSDRSMGFICILSCISHFELYFLNVYRALAKFTNS